MGREAIVAPHFRPVPVVHPTRLESRSRLSAATPPLLYLRRLWTMAVGRYPPGSGRPCSEIRTGAATPHAKKRPFGPRVIRRIEDIQCLR